MLNQRMRLNKQKAISRWTVAKRREFELKKELFKARQKAYYERAAVTRTNTPSEKRVKEIEKELSVVMERVFSLGLGVAAWKLYR